jgi:sugar phosphate isomerase/epimerase
MLSSALPRRRFIVGSAVTLGALFCERRAFAAASSQRFPIITFTKPFQSIGFEETAELIAEVGYDGIECPLRKNGQIVPERVEEDLPKLQEALKKRRLDLTLITTDVAKVNPLNEKVLRTAAKLGVKRYRLAFSQYDLTKPIPPQLANLKSQLRDLAALNKELGIQGGIQNHSGRDHIGAPVWDIYELIADLDPKHLGTCFDIGHATLEGGYAWPINAKLMEPFFTCVYVKDFLWKKSDKGWSAEWRPLGEGMVSRTFFEWLKSSAYSGPISQHCEYLKGGGPAERAQMKKDLAVLKGWLA